MRGSSRSLSALDLDGRETALTELLASSGEIALAAFRAVAKQTNFSMKGPQDYLTETDGEVERHIKGVLAEKFPGDGFFGEESGGAASAAAWVVDPIDGTANFMRGIPHFCTSIAFMADDRVELGGIFNPATGDLYVARRGRGATRNGRPINVAKTRDFDRATVEFGWSPRISNSRYVETIAALLALGANVRRSGSGAMALAYVSDGRTDAYAELHMNAWDCLAGQLLVTEAGGRINNFLQNNGLMRGNPVLASAPGIAEGVARATGIELWHDIATDGEREV